MATTPQMSNEPNVLPTAAAGADSGPEAFPPPSEPWTEEHPQRTEAFDALVEDVRRVYSLGSEEVLRSLQYRLRRRLGLAPVSAGTAALMGLTGIGIRLGLALLVTAVAGQWVGIPWGRWVVILAFYGLADAGRTFTFPASDAPVPPWLRRTIENWTALLPTVVRESDLRDLARLTRRLNRMAVVAAAGVVVAAVMLGTCRLFTPAAMGELHAGSVALLALLLFDFGALPIWGNNLVNWATTTRQARYEHHLFWPSPADSPEVRSAMGRTAYSQATAALWITMFLVMTAVLVGWDSPLVLPLAVGFVVIGYLTTIGLAVFNRASVRKIIERSRRERLQGLQSRIATFGPRYTNLSPSESEELRELLFLHDRIRDAPSTPTTARTLMRTATTLIVPTIAFVITVFGEVSAERFLDAILP